MKLLVTGGAGFIGSNFIRYWLKKYPQDRIVNLDKLTYAGHLTSLKEIEKNPHYLLIKGDIIDSKIVQKAMSQAEVIVHFAAETHVDRSIKGPASFIKTNVLGTQVLLDVARKCKVKHFHHVSTDEVFGSLDEGTKKKFSERSNYNPRSPYSASKAASDHLVRAYYETYNLPITITNCSNNFGPFQDPEKFIPRAITNLLDNKKVPLYGDGKYIRDWLYVEDHVRAIELVLKKGKIGETYLVGGQIKNLSNLEIVQKIIQILGKDINSIEYVKDRPGHDRKYAVNWQKINHKLGWSPKYTFDDWLVKTVRWYEENEKWWRPLKTKAEAFYQR